jgi:diguanylate cyclase (GGDEF)-like protein
MPVLLPMLLWLLLMRPRRPLLYALLTWALISLPVLVHVLSHQSELLSARGAELMTQLGPVSLMLILYVAFQRQLETMFEELRQQSSRWQSLAERDALTGCYNRRAAENYLRSSVRVVGSVRALLLVDLDHFKRINDQHGHDIGDAVLKQVASLLQHHADRTGGVAARWGGEEFMLLVQGESFAAVSGNAEALRAEIAATEFPVVGRVTASLGMTELRPTDDPDAAYKRADIALYDAKRHGRNLLIVN